MTSDLRGQGGTRPALPEVLALDGGGSRCRLAAEFAADGDRVVVESGPANISSDLAGGIAAVLEAVAKLAGELELSSARLWQLPMYAGLAGVTGPELAVRVATELPFERVRVDDDRSAAIRGALGEDDGAVVHCGTGSFFAVQHAGELSTAGGWGAVLGDHASAMWLGREILSCVLDVHDKLGNSTALVEALNERFDSPSRIVGFARDATPAEFGALAPLVTRAAAQGDVAACHLMRRGAEHICGVIGRLGWQSGAKICLTGSLAPHYHDYLDAQFARDVAPAKGEPIDGAISLAREFERELCT